MQTRIEAKTQVNKRNTQNKKASRMVFFKPQDKVSIESVDPIDFTPLTDDFKTMLLPILQIKRPSKVLPAEEVISQWEGFHMGLKNGTGSSSFYQLLPKLKEAFGVLPPSKKGKLVDMINLTRNEARQINENIKKLVNQLVRVMEGEELSLEVKKEAGLMSFYFLESNFKKLNIVLINLNVYNGLLKGNAMRGFTGNLVAGKEPVSVDHPYLKMKDIEKKIEMDLLVKLSCDESFLNNAKSQLQQLGLSQEDYQVWRSKNATPIEISLNTAKGAGRMIGEGIQGTAICAINFGIAAATLNPFIFAAGAYYAVSTVVKVAEIGQKTKYANQIIGLNAIKYNENTQTNHAVSMVQVQSQMDVMNNIEKIHHVVDNASNVFFGASSIVFAVPVSTGRPTKEAQEGVRASSIL